jgi:pyruvate/2-oxoglutarate dehydrogenase complex dihydrolipoamide dehydrogenase (E3) component
MLLQEVQGRSGEQITLHLERAGGPLRLTGTHLLVATGRTPNTNGLIPVAATLDVH